MVTIGASERLHMEKLSQLVRQPTTGAKLINAAESITDVLSRIETALREIDRSGMVVTYTDNIGESPFWTNVGRWTPKFQVDINTAHRNLKEIGTAQALKKWCADTKGWLSNIDRNK